jgi:hypothetical protein
LKLRKIIGGNIMAKKMAKATGKEITESFREIIIKINGRMNNTARSVSSLRLVTDVR